MHVRGSSVAVVVGLLVGPAFAQTAGMLSFQGFIKDAQGDPLNGTVELEFRIYDAEIGGVLESGPFGPTTVTAINGVVAAKFGPIDPAVFDGCVPSTPCRWLEVGIDDGSGPVPLSRIEMVTAVAASEQVNIPASGTPAIEVDGSGNISILGTIQAGSSITINGLTDTITAGSGTIGFDDENLTTTGLIESTVAGFKFPDATIQTTAAVPDGDTLGELLCADREVAKWNETLSKWACAPDDDTDTMAALPCADGEVAKWNETLSQWACAPDVDTDTLAALACTEGEIAKWNDGTSQWECAADDAGGGASTLDEAYDGGGAGAGRTITADAGAVTIEGPHGLTVLGTITAGSSITIDGVANTVRARDEITVASHLLRLGRMV